MATAKSLTPNASEQLAQARASTAKALNERSEQAEKAAQAAKEAAQAREEAAAEQAAANGTLQREVGLVEGTLKVFIDLVEPESKKSLFRVFGPEDANKPKEEAPAPKSAATTAYTRNTAPTPLKDVGIA